MELKDYWRLIRNHWGGVLLFTLLGGALVGGWSLFQPPVYQATSSGFVSSGGGTDPGLASLEDSLAKSRARSYLVLAKDPVTADLVRQQLGLEDPASALVTRISVEQPPDTVLIQITAVGGSAQSAQALADAWVDALAVRVDQIENPKQAKNKPSTMAVSKVASADLPTTPVSPRPLRDGLIGGLAGVILGFAYAFARSQLDRRIRSAAQVDRLGAHVVATLPEVAGGKNLGIIATGSEQGRSVQASEAFRKLRTNISYLDVDNPPKIIVVTSPSQGDGKSSVATNLAAVIAVGGQPVTLIDGDLRRPRVATALNVSGDIGLTDVLAGRVTLDDALIKHEGLPNLHILASGNRPPNPSELLGSQAMRKVLLALAERGMVIVDAPPLLPVTDAAVLTRAADGALVVVSAGKTIDTHLEGALDNLRSVQGRVLGVVLNRVTRRRTTSDYYKQQYQYSYDQDKGRSSGGKRRSTSSASSAGESH